MHCIPKNHSIIYTEICSSPFMHATVMSTGLLYNIYRKLQSYHISMQQWWTQSFPMMYTENPGSRGCCMQSRFLIHAATTSTKLLSNICKRIAILPFMHAATASHELFYDIHRKWRSRCWCMQQQWAESFFIIYTENCSLIIAVHILMVNTEFLYNTFWKSRSRRSCMQQRRAESCYTRWPKKVLLFDKSLNNGLLFYCLNILRFWIPVYNLRLWHLNHSNPIKPLSDTPT